MKQLILIITFLSIIPVTGEKAMQVHLNDSTVTHMVAGIDSVTFHAISDSLTGLEMNIHKGDTNVNYVNSEIDSITFYDVKDTFDVYFLAGQSNAVGRANAADITPASLKNPQTDVLLYYHKSPGGTQTMLPADQFINLAPGSANGAGAPTYPKEFGPEVNLGRTLADGNPTRKILIVKYAYGGTTLFDNWSASGGVYKTFISTANSALTKLTERGDAYILKGFAWVQGEADANVQPNTYQTNLVNLIKRVRTDVFSGIDAPFVLSRLSDNQYPTGMGAGQITVRAAQTAVPGLLPKVKYVNTDDNSLYTVRSDKIHFDAKGQLNLGKALAQALISLN
ncbi:MAG: hypothetical protein HQK83_09310 [Fibrobacteria bacterium]|nr:hypothetical protein [Fibrobacteria bacterium]